MNSYLVCDSENNDKENICLCSVQMGIFVCLFFTIFNSTVGLDSVPTEGSSILFLFMDDLL